MVARKHGKAKCFGQGRECFQLQQLSVQYLILCLTKTFVLHGIWPLFSQALRVYHPVSTSVSRLCGFFSPHIARQMLTLYVSMPGFGIKEWRSHMIEQSKEKKTKQNQQKQQTTLHKPNRNKKTQTHKLHYKNEHYQNACC